MTAPEALHLLATTSADLAALGLAQSQTLPDTIVTVQAGTYGFQRVVQTLQSIASVVIALALIALSVSLIPAAWNTRKFYKQVNDLIKRFKNDVDPIIRHARHHHVEDDQVRPMLLGDLQPLATVGGGDDAEAFAFHVEANELDDVRLIVDDENGSLAAHRVPLPS